MAASSSNELVSRLVSLYRDEILPVRTRRVHLLGRKCTPRLMRTFLGYELQLGQKRVTCPDQATARYLRIFGEIGLASVLIPYEPQRTAEITPALESCFDELKRTTDEAQRLRNLFRQLRKRLLGAEREARKDV